MNSKGGKMEGRAKKKTSKVVSRSHGAGLTFPVARIASYLKAGKYAKRIGAAAPVYLSAVLQSLAREMLELAGNAAMDHRKKRIIPRHIKLGVGNDDEQGKLLGSATIPNAGALPKVHNALLPKMRVDKKRGKNCQKSL